MPSRPSSALPLPHPATDVAGFDLVVRAARRAIRKRMFWRWVVVPLLAAPLVLTVPGVLAQELFGFSYAALSSKVLDVTVAAAPVALTVGAASARVDRFRRRRSGWLVSSALMVRCAQPAVTASGRSSTVFLSPSSTSLSPTRREIAPGNLDRVSFVGVPFTRRSCVIELLDPDGRPCGTLVVRASLQRVSAVLGERMSTPPA